MSDVITPRSTEIRLAILLPLHNPLLRSHRSERLVCVCPVFLRVRVPRMFLVRVRVCPVFLRVRVLRRV